MTNLEVYIKNGSRDINGLLNMAIKDVDTNVSSDVIINTKQLFKSLKLIPEQKSLDIWLFSVYIHLIDNLLPRNEIAVDNWLREINVKIPVSDSLVWNSNSNSIIDALNFLTGDEWNIEFYQLGNKYFCNDELELEEDINIEKVCLLSGGLDSLAGAINLINSDNDILFVSHFDGAGAIDGEQENIFEELERSVNDKKLYLSQFHVYPSNNLFYSADSNQRARSILFLGFALFHAINFNVNEIVLPENGLISINLPLNESRTSSNSTRTTHPYFIKKLEQFIFQVGINISIVNPYQYKTKGEMLDECLDKNLLNLLINKTISCSHYKRRGPWTRKVGINNCGYCIPCLIRRASIYRYNNLATIERYGVDLNAIELKLDTTSKISTDIFALINFLNKKYDIKKYEREISLIASTENKKEIAQMLYRGYNELRKYIEDNASTEIKRLLT
jgi:hypothetical protein